MAESATGKFVNTSGESFAIKGISPLILEKIRAAVQEEWKAAGKEIGPAPEPPTYEVTDAAGDQHQVKHDAKSAEENDETKAAWAAYQGKLADWQLLVDLQESEINKRILRAITLCVIVDKSAYAQWIEEQEFIGVPVPETPAARLSAYVETHVISSTDDVFKLMTAVMKVSGMADDQVAEAAERSFRAAMEQAKQDAAPVQPGPDAG